MRNIVIQQKGQVQEVQVTVKDAAQEAQEAWVNCEEANVSQKLLLKDVEKKVKMKVKMKKKKFCSLLPNKKPYKVQTQQTPPIQQTQQCQLAQQTQQTPPIQQTQQSQIAQQT